MINLSERISASKKRCQTFGLNPVLIPKPSSRLTSAELQNRRVKFDELLSVMSLFAGRIMHLLNSTPLLLVLTDEKGYILEMYGDQLIKKTITELGIVKGIQYTEESMGTNSVHMALTEHSPVSLIGQEHYHEALHQSACYSVPFQFTGSHNLSGTISLLTTINHQNPIIIALLSNIVDSIERELLLSRNNHQLDLLNRILIKNMRHGIIITDPYGRVSECNPFAEQITNCKKHDLLGSSIFDIQPFGKYMYKVLEYRKSYENVELTFGNLQNGGIVCQFDSYAIYDDKNRVIGAYAQFRDITERFLLERQVITAEKFSVIGKLAAGLAHEIRNPLTSIIGFIKILKTSEHPAEKEQKYIEIVYNELLQLNKLISQFVLMAKPSFPDRKRFNIQELVQETLFFMESQFIFKNVSVQFLHENNPIMLHADPLQIKQVLINILQNALEAVDEKGMILVSLEADLNHVKIRIEDNGIGLDDDELNQILNPFFTTKENGLGLGLSVSYRIIENHGGTIDITSNKHAGTTMTITLPLLQA